MGIYLTKNRIGPSHSECDYNPDLSVVLVNEETGVRTPILDKDGNFCHFPGITPCDALCAEMDIANIPPRVRYESTFQKCENGQFLMLWTVRPDGRFWMDSWGFGGEDYEWVELYAYLDENGQFTAPFRLYSIGYQKFVSLGEGTE